MVFSSELADVVPSNGVVLPGAEYPGTDAMLVETRYASQGR
jgi:hypothetical protein